MKKVLPILLLAVIFSSGCTIPDFLIGPQIQDAGYGVVIKKFEPDFPQAYSGEKADFLLKIKNTGSVISRNGEASVSIGEWDCMPNSMFTTNFEELLPVDKERGVEGEEIDIVWSCIPPEIEETLHLPYTARAFVEYDYKTITTTTVNILPKDELRGLMLTGDSLPATPKSTTLSPVTLDVSVNGPVRLKNDDSIEFPVTITINNAAGGLIEESKVDLVVHGSNGISKAGIDECNYEGFHIWRDRSQTITCNMRADQVDDITFGEITAQINYRYISTAEAQIDLVGEKAAFLR